MSITLSLKDRAALIGRALIGSVDVAPDSVGGRLLAGVIRPGGDPAPRSTAEFLQAYGDMPWFHAALSRVSYDVASTEWRVMVPRRAGKAVLNRMVQRASGPQRKLMLGKLQEDGELDILTDHPAVTLLDNANPMQTGLMARRTTQIHMDAVGESFWLLERNPLNMPIHIWPLPPSWVSGTPTPAHPFFRVSFRGWQGEVPSSEIIWFSDVNPANPYGRGVGTGQALSDELETDEYAARMTKALFFNRARPDLIVWPKGEMGLKEDEVRRLEENWNRHNQGFWRAFRPFFLKREVEIKELDTSFRSLQFVQLREFERDTILQVFGVSPEILGIVKSGSSRATVTVADRIYAKRVQIPRLELLRSVMQERLMPLFDERLIIDYVSPEVQDEELQLEAKKAASWAFSVDEWRASGGAMPLPDDTGKKHVIQNTLTTIDFGNLPLKPGPGVEPEVPEDPEDDAEEMGPRRAMLRSVSKQLFDAGAAAHQGLLVSLWLEPEAAQALALEGGEPADQLHVTLGYCGKVTELGDVAVARAIVAVAQEATLHAPLAGKVNGVGRFSASGASDGRDVLYAVPDVPGLAELRHCVAETLREVGVAPRQEHGWTPHITLDYVEPGAGGLPAVPAVPLRFAAVSVSVGNQRADLPLGPVMQVQPISVVASWDDDVEAEEYLSWSRAARRALRAGR